ncbi:unnamed protein product [Linum trigynum]|uniref:Uncharacterized protein n=1 Tax=Linum trigynum TaxID=586398 RepID=A0AAV2GT28_9ROSI
MGTLFFHVSKIRVVVTDATEIPNGVCSARRVRTRISHYIIQLGEIAELFPDGKERRYWGSSQSRCKNTRYSDLSWFPGVTGR